MCSFFVASAAVALPSRASLYCTLSDAATLWEERRSPGYCCLLFYFRLPSIHFIILPFRTRRWLRFAGAERGSRVSQIVLNLYCERMRAPEHAPRGPFYFLERRRGLAQIVEGGAVGFVERLRVNPPRPRGDRRAWRRGSSRVSAHNGTSS